MNNKKFSLTDFNFNLPEKLIAQYPEETRDDSKLFIINKESGEYLHKKFNELHNHFNNNDLLIFNNAKVINARIFFFRESGAKVEITLMQRKDNLRWLSISNRTKRLKVDEKLYSIIKPGISIKILNKIDNYIEIQTNVDFTDALLYDIGSIPLPPYIKRDPQLVDRSRYQTIYALKSGAVAAPTAGLHFTGGLMEKLKDRGVGIDFITLDVSWGTFQPVRSDDLSKHKMHSEKYYLTENTAKKINKARKDGKRVIAVGTTTVRVLESTFSTGINEPGIGETDIFIYPPEKIKSIDALLTNFHTPFSTLLMLVSSFAGYNRIMDAYKTAVELNYRFFSYGDAMLIE